MFRKFLIVCFVFLVTVSCGAQPYRRSVEPSAPPSSPWSQDGGETPLPASPAVGRTSVDKTRNLPQTSLADILGQPQGPAPAVPTEPGVVGLLLPLSGRFSGIGTQVRAAVEMAFDERGAKTRLVVLDTEGTEEGARAAVDALLDEHGAIAALGPVGAVESQVAAEAACERGLPLLPLSRGFPDGVCREYAVRALSSVRDEGVAAGVWAIAELGVRRVAVLRPENNYGDVLEAGFVDAVERLGGLVVNRVRYEPGTQDYLPVLESLLGRRLPTAKGIPADEVGFELLFVADTAKAARRVLPYLKYARVPLRRDPSEPGLQILGPGSWNSTKIIDPSEQITENVVFVSAFDADPGQPLVRQFQEQFEVRHGLEATPYQAECYDAAALLFDVIDEGQHETREGLRDGLWHAGNRMGVTGVWTLREGGEVRRSLHVLTVDGDGIRARRSEEEERTLRLPSP